MFKIFADELPFIRACSSFFSLSSESFADGFYSQIISAVALPIVPKVEFNFETKLYITIFLFSTVQSKMAAKATAI